MASAQLIESLKYDRFLGNETRNTKQGRSKNTGSLHFNRFAPEPDQLAVIDRLLPDLEAGGGGRAAVNFSGKGFSIGSQSSRISWEVGAEFSSLFGPLAKAGFTTQVGDDQAVRMDLTAGPRHIETLGVFGTPVADNQLLRFSLHHLRQKKLFGFESGEERAWVSQTTGAATWRMYSDTKGALAEYVDLSTWYSVAASRDLQDRDFSVDTPFTFTLYRDPRRIAGRTQAGIESKISLRLAPHDTLSLSAGFQREKQNTLVESSAFTRGVGSIRWEHDFSKSSRLTAGLRTSPSSRTAELKWIQDFSNGSAVFLQLSRNVGTTGIGNDTRIEIKYSMQLEHSPRVGAADLQLAGQHIPVSRRVFETVKEKLDFLPSMVAAAIDTTAQKQLLLQINKQNLPAGATVLPNGDVSVNFGTSLGTFTSAVNTSTGAGLPASLFVINGANLVIRVAQLEPFLAGSSAAAPHTLTLTTSATAITVQAFKGSVHILSIKAAATTAANSGQYQDVNGIACASSQPTPGCTFLRSNSTRISVSADPHYDRYGYGSDDLWYVKFNGTGVASVYNDLGSFQYSSNVDEFSGYIGGTTIGVGTTATYWENVAGGTYWLGKNGVLYNANMVDANFGKAIN